MAKVTFKTERCKGCGLCVAVCPRKILVLSKKEVNSRGYHPAECVDQEKCISCAFCARMCPDCVITVEK